MGLLSGLVGGGAASVIDSVSEAVGRFVETPDEKNAHELQMRAMDLEIVAKQIEVNQTEAAHRSLWVAGWRPAVGWTCAAALAWTFIVQPLLVYLLAVLSPETDPPPGVDLAGLYPVLLGMLGLGGLRTVEKAKGVAR